VRTLSNRQGSLAQKTETRPPINDASITGTDRWWNQLEISDTGSGDRPSPFAPTAQFLQRSSSLSILERVAPRVYCSETRLLHVELPARSSHVDWGVFDWVKTRTRADVEHRPRSTGQTHEPVSPLKRILMRAIRAVPGAGSE